MEPKLQEEVNVMGLLRCAQDKGHKSFIVYKKRFWVVNELQGCLELYKNDQEPFPQAKFSASEVRGVIFSGGKRKMLYGLVLQLRGGRNIMFQFNSVAERDRWHAAITRLICRYSTYSCNQNLLRVAQQRTMTAERSLGVNITLAVARLSDIPDNFLQYLVEAVDIAIETISGVVHTYGGEMEVPRRYTITVAVADSHTHVGPQYDPTTRSLVLQVWISRDMLGNVCFKVADPSDILKITQSHVWRDPRIEGWITTNHRCVAVCREIGELLGMKKSFPFSFQWGQNLLDTKRVEQYLHQHVHVNFLHNVQKQILEVVEDFKLLRVFSDDTVYIKYLGDYVSGIAITLDESTVCADKPPKLFVTTTVEYQRRCRQAVVMTSRYLEAYSKHRVVVKSLKDQLVEVILLADLSRRLSESKVAFSQAFGRTDCVKVMWDCLLKSCARIGVSLSQNSLSQLVIACSNIYQARLESLQQLLTSIKFSSEGGGPLFATLFKHVVSLVVDFVPFIAGDMKTLPQPKFQEGNVTDYILCCTEEQHNSMMKFIGMKRAMPQVNKAYPVVCGLFVFPSMPVAAFKEWSEAYLYGNSEVCEDVNGDDSSSRLSVACNDLGDAVAFERNAETQVLDLHRVVNMVYDSQGAAVNLKIGANAIRSAVDALQVAFGGLRICRHDLVRVLTSNLRRLRAMYSRALGGEAVGCLDLASAVQLLHELCEYEENEYGLEELLKQSAQQQMQLMTHTGNETPEQQNSGNTPVLRTHVYDFQCVSRVALNHVLPREAKVARLAWRVGLVAGLENVGKTLILNSLQGVVQPTFPSVGLSQRVLAFEEWVFGMNELGGRESFRENWRHYVARMEAVDFVFFVVDAMSKVTFKDASIYLQEITDHFTNLPLVVVVNNYRIGYRGTPTLDSVLSLLKIDKVQKCCPKRSIFVGTCDITVVSSLHRVAPPTLLSAVQELGTHLRQISPPDQRPSQPKKGVDIDSTMMQTSSFVSRT